MKVHEEVRDFSSLSKRYAFLVSRYARWVKKRCFNFDIEDVQQELWLVFVKVRQSFNPDLGKFEHALSRALHNASFNLVRKSIRRYPAMSGLNDDLVATFEAPDARLVFQDALSMLNPRQRMLALKLVSTDDGIREQEWRQTLRAKRTGGRTRTKGVMLRMTGSKSKDLVAIEEAIKGRVVKENEGQWLAHLRTAKIRAAG